MSSFQTRKILKNLAVDFFKCGVSNMLYIPLRYLTFPHSILFKLTLYSDLTRNDVLYFGSKSDVTESTCRINASRRAGHLNSILPMPYTRMFYFRMLVTGTTHSSPTV